ncbi:hypothetical protein BH18PSE1_BH18PSE1_07370 [soil metagenome]
MMAQNGGYLARAIAGAGHDLVQLADLGVVKILRSVFTEIIVGVRERLAHAREVALPGPNRGGGQGRIRAVLVVLVIEFVARRVGVDEIAQRRITADGLGVEEAFSQVLVCRYETVRLRRLGALRALGRRLVLIQKPQGFLEQVLSPIRDRPDADLLAVINAGDRGQAEGLECGAHRDGGGPRVIVQRALGHWVVRVFRRA